MVSFQRDADVRRDRRGESVTRIEARKATTDRNMASFDPRDGQLLRGLVFGLPLGLVIWLLLALTVWRFA